MSKKILLTSFDTWLPHHTSNSSDDLLEEIAKLNLPYLLTFVRRLPVDIQRASDLVIAKIIEVQPDLIICCGMAEKRTKLTIESQATCENTILKTQVDLEKLVTELSATQISHDAGKFVCEGLYYSILNYLTSGKASNSDCIFVHVPILNKTNLQVISSDFQLIIKKNYYSSRKYKL